MGLISAGFVKNTSAFRVQENHSSRGFYCRTCLGRRKIITVGPSVYVWDLVWRDQNEGEESAQSGDQSWENPASNGSKENFLS